MKKEFVPYEIALELKELGFDEPCFGFYIENSVWTPASYSREGIVYPSNKDLLPGWVSSPTFSQAFRWFREKHQISPSIHCMSEQGNSWRYHIPNEGGENNFNTYEEAEQACLRKLIEIIKEKK